ncbi:MAG: sigma 54-interacting transcriptional regulator [Woeseiaceae bacterium]|nr:sigma 54-interacting transcriptional regulator [Woeseiaceae bacterium]
MIAVEEFDVLVRVVDLAVVLLAIVLFGYAMMRGYLKTERIPARGMNLIVAGMVLLVIGHFSDSLLQLLGPGRSGVVDGILASYYSSGWFNWLVHRLAFVLIAIGLLVAALHRRRIEVDFKEVESEAEDARESVRANESRLRYMFANSSDSVYCFRFDPPIHVSAPLDEQIARSYEATLEDCNSVFARELHVDTPADAIGTRLGDLESSQDKEAHEAYFAAFARNDYRLEDYDFQFTDPLGIARTLNVNLSGDVRDGKLHRMWVVENYVRDLRETKAALARRNEFHALVADLSSRLVKAPNERANDEVVRCMGLVCSYLNAQRSVIFWLKPDAKEAEVAYIHSPSGNPFGPLVSLTRYPGFVARLEEGKPVQIDDVAALSEGFGADQRSMVDVGAKSLLALPLTAGGEVVGGISFVRTREKQAWREHDISDLTVIAEIFANFVVRLKSRRALDEALSSLRSATRRLEAENIYLREEIELTHGFDDFVGQSRGVMRCLQLVEQVAPTRAPVLVMGETGTGKELIARAIHELSDRKDRPLVKVNCAALPANLVESELFGYEKGAFTGAEAAKRGRFDLADGSTLFLDEIAEIPIELQAKLLRVLQEGEFERLGGGETIRVDVRLVAATNRNLHRAVYEGAFRSDLYYRINTFPIELPPLRDRGDDIQLLAEHFVRMHGQRLGRNVSEISADMMGQLRSYRWPGNVRELEGIIQRALISSDGEIVELAEPLVEHVDTDDAPRIISSTIADLKLVEREHILAVLEATNWKISGPSGAAAQLGLPPSTLRSKMKKLSIERPH